MKIIVTHDVDHLYVSEHLSDLIIPKFIVRALIELFTHHISFRTFCVRMKCLLKNRWHRIPELIKFDKAHGVPSTYYWGMSKGMGLCYSQTKASALIQLIKENGLANGVHGIEAADHRLMKEEYDRFYKITGDQEFGIRMHYLNVREGTLEGLSDAGYQYDSSVYGLQEPFLVGQMWEMPLSLMESYLFEGGKRWQTKNLEQAKNETIEKLNVAGNSGLSYFVILFHDRYYDESFPEWKGWYEWLCEYVISQGYNLISMEDAVRELKDGHANRSRSS